MSSLVILSSDENEIKDINEKLSEDGFHDNLSEEHKLRYIWRLYKRSECSLLSSVEDINKLRKQQADDMVQVEEYISHIQQLSDEQKKFLTDYEKENDHLKNEAESIKKVLEESLDLFGEENRENSTFEKIENLANKHKVLNESFDQLRIEKEILSETLSEHSSSFKEEIKLVDYLNKDTGSFDDLSDMLKTTEPLEKMKILMNIAQKQNQDLKSMKHDRRKLQEYLLLHDEHFDMEQIIENLKAKDEKHQSLQDDLFALKKTLIDPHHKSLNFSLHVDSDDDDGDVEDSEIEEEFSTQHFIEITQRFQIMKQEINDLNQQVTSINSVIDSVDLVFHQGATIEEKILSLKESLAKQSDVIKEKDECMSKLAVILNCTPSEEVLVTSISKMKNTFELQEIEINNIKLIFDIKNIDDDLVSAVESCVEAMTEKIDSLESDLNSVKEMVGCSSNVNVIMSLKLLIDERANLKQLVEDFAELNDTKYLQGEERTEIVLDSLNDIKTRLKHYMSEEEEIREFVHANCEKAADDEMSLLVLFDEFTKLKKSEELLKREYISLEERIKEFCVGLVGREQATEDHDICRILQKYEENKKSEMLELVYLIHDSGLVDIETNYEDIKENLTLLIQRCKDSISNKNEEISSAKQLLCNNLQCSELLKDEKLEDSIRVLMDGKNQAQTVIDDFLRENGFENESQILPFERKITFFSDKVREMKSDLNKAESEKLKFEETETLLKAKIDAIKLPGPSLNEDILSKIEHVQEHVVNLESVVDDHQSFVKEIESLSFNLIDDGNDNIDDINNNIDTHQRLRSFSKRYQKLCEEASILHKIEQRMEASSAIVDTSKSTLENFDRLAEEHVHRHQTLTGKNEQLISLENVIKDCHKDLQEVEDQTTFGIFVSGGDDASFDEITNQFKKNLCKLCNDLRTIKQCLGDGGSSHLPTIQQCVQIAQRIAQEKQQVSRTIENLQSTTTTIHEEPALTDIGSFEDLSNAFLVLLKVYAEIKSRLETLQKEHGDLETQNTSMKQSLEQQNGEIETLLSNIERLEMSKQENDLEIQKLQTEKESLERQLEDQSKRIEGCNEAYESLLLQNNQCKIDNESILTLENGRTQLLEENDLQRQDIEQLESERTRLSEELRLLKSVHGQISGKAKSLAQDLKSLKQEHKEREENLQIKIEALELTLEDERVEFDQLQTDYEEKISLEQRKNEKLTDEMELLRHDLTSVEEDKNTLQTQVESLLKETLSHDTKIKNLEEEHSTTLDSMVHEFQQRLDEKEEENESLGNEMMAKNDQLIEAQASLKELKSLEKDFPEKKAFEETNFRLRQQLTMKDDQLQMSRAENIKFQNKITELKVQLKFTQEKLEKHRTAFDTLKNKLKKRSMEIRMKEDSETSYRNQITHLQETNEIQTELLCQLKRELQELRDENGHVKYQSESLKRLADRESGRTKDVVVKATKVKSQNSELKNTLKEAIEELHQL